MVNLRFWGKEKSPNPQKNKQKNPNPNQPNQTKTPDPTNQWVSWVPQTWKYPLPHEYPCSSVCFLHHLLHSAAYLGKLFSFLSHFFHSGHQHYILYAWCFQVLQLFLQWPEIRTIILDKMHAAQAHSLHHTGLSQLIKTTTSMCSSYMS